MNNTTLKIAFIGHVDHGKSTLLGRLLLETNSLAKGKMAQIKRISQELGKSTELAFLSDQLKEERDGNLTIDTTQFFLKTHKRNYIFIDNPGHFQLIKNMLTGTTQANAAILVIDIKEGLMEQTRSHAEIISMLGIDQTIVVFNKMDIVNYSELRFIKAKKSILEFLETLSIKPAFVMPVSAKEGLNISKKSLKLSWYKGPTMVKALNKLKLSKKSEKKPLRFPIQDIQEINNEKIITGKVVSGIIRQAQEVIILPTLKKTKVKAIKVFGKRNRTKAKTGENIGLILEEPLLFKRGEVIVQKANTLKLTSCLRGNIFWIADRSLKINELLTLRCATQEVKCIVEKITKRINPTTLEILSINVHELKQNEIGMVVLKTKTIIIAEKFDFIEELGRFILERENQVCACGIITQKL